MDAEEDPTMASTPAGFGKASTQCKLLETIFEDPKHGADGRERLTSVRKYKRFIDFTVGPTASKKWKRSQKARKLAVCRQSLFQHQGHPEVFECPQDAFTRLTQRKTRVRGPASVYQNGTDHALIAIDKRSACYNNMGGGACAAVDSTHSLSQSELCSQAGCNNGSFEPNSSSGLPDTLIVSSGDLFVEEAATVELPLGCASNNGASIDVEVRSSIEDLLTAVVVSSHGCSLDYPSVRAGDVKHSRSCNGNAGGASPDGLLEVRPTAEPRRAQSRMRLSARRGPRKQASVWAPRHPVDRSVEGTMSELIAIIEATDNLCEGVVEDCSLSSCNVDREIVNQLLHSFVERVPENVP